MTHHRTLVAAAAAVLLAGCALTPTQRAPLKLTVLHTNDHHGRFWPNSDGEYGLAARKTLIDRIRAEVAAAGGHVLLLDGGDVNTGVPESDLQDAEPDFKGMNLLGYDASAIGNHEFDKPLAVLEKQRQWSKFPLLAANIYNKSSGQRQGWMTSSHAMRRDCTGLPVRPKVTKTSAPTKAARITVTAIRRPSGLPESP
jgi:5'-nucleotidase/UDP-sugar diphosphatase